MNALPKVWWLISWLSLTSRLPCYESCVSHLSYVIVHSCLCPGFIGFLPFCLS